MQAVFREYEEWLGDEDMPEYLMRGFTRAETKLEKCLPYEDALVNYVIGIFESLRLKTEK